MGTDIGLSSCCISGAIRNGIFVGNVSNVGGLPTYVSEPENKSKSKTVIFLTDIFGWEFNNTRLLADSYAKAGFYVYVPDLHQGDSLPVSLLQSIEPPLKERNGQAPAEKKKNHDIVGTTLGPWLGKHPESTSRPLIENFIAVVNSIPGTGKIGTVGFCWGGRYTILSAKLDEVSAAYACHPSLLSIPSDFEGLTKPLSLAVGSEDSLLDMASIEKIKGLLSNLGSPTQVKVYPDQVHGFALRGDWSSEKDKKAMEDTEKQGIAWFNKYLS